MKKRIGVLAALCLSAVFWCGQAAAENTVSYQPTDRFFVNDFAGVLSAEAENTIYTLGVRLQE